MKKVVTCSQLFRFCLSCARETLIKDDCCYFCKKKFILTALTDDLKIMPRKKYEEAH